MNPSRARLAAPVQDFWFKFTSPLSTYMGHPPLVSSAAPRGRIKEGLERFELLERLELFSSWRQRRVAIFLEHRRDPPFLRPQTSGVNLNPAEPPLHGGD